MSVVQNIITPIFQLIVYIVLIGWGCFIVYWIFKNSFKNLKWKIKYGLLKRSYSEKDVAWCMDAINQGMKPIDAKKFLLIKGQHPKRVDEIMYIFNQIQKRMKGGDKNVGQFEQSDGEVKEIPKIKKGS